jgi:Patatin-like phospholipase
MRSNPLSRRRFLVASSALTASAAVASPRTNATSLPATADSKYLIVACDGGGIRGLITALLLDQLNTHHPEFLPQTYLNAGTSTGGIISLGLACGLSTGQLVDIYRTGGAQIFKPSACLSNASAPPIAPNPPRALQDTVAGNWWQFLLTYLDDIVCPWYDQSGL